jgi:hypothetical protein
MLGRPATFADIALTKTDSIVFEVGDTPGSPSAAIEIRGDLPQVALVQHGVPRMASKWPGAATRKRSLPRLEMLTVPRGFSMTTNGRAAFVSHGSSS